MNINKLLENNLNNLKNEMKNSIFISDYYERTDDEDVQNEEEFHKNEEFPIGQFQFLGYDINLLKTTLSSTEAIILGEELIKIGNYLKNKEESILS